MVDINSPPEFEQHLFSVRIPENSPIGFHVLALRAHDRDRHANAKLHYELNDSEQFTIDPEMGVVSVDGELDREKMSSYTLNISVIDSGTPPLATHTLLEVVLDDGNFATFDPALFG